MQAPYGGQPQVNPYGGQPQVNPYAPQPYPAYGTGALPKNGLATASLILGVVGFVVTLIPFFIGLLFGGVLNILAFIFGIVGAVNAKRVGNLGQGPAVAGIVLSCVAFLLMFVGAGTIW
jgi:hypothetical protein